jgi:SIR2-like domain
MEFLKPLFEEQLTAQISDAGDVVIEGIPWSPVRILRSESDAYQTAFEGWKNNYLDLCREKADEILNAFDNRDRFQRLQDALSIGNVIPFLGAGMSCSSGFRSWTSYIWALQADSHIPEYEIRDLLENGQYEEAAEKLLDDLGERLFNERLNTTYRTGANRHITGPVQYLPRFSSRAVITTNFDDLLERLYESSGCPFKRVLLGIQGTSLIRHMGDSGQCLFKMHGDYAEPVTRVLTKREYDVAYAKGSDLTETMKYVLRANTFLFIGCSLSQDRTMQLMLSLANEVRDLPHHYAFLPLPQDDIKRKVRQKFLADRSIFPIWYPDEEHDSSIEALFVKLLPSENLA